MQFLFASQNKSKIAESEQIFSSTKHQLLSLNDYHQLINIGVKIPAGLIVNELGKTLQENALIKAQAFNQLTKLPCIADDSGLFLAALPDFPGVNSNRWFKGDDRKRNLALLKKIENKSNRQAKFQTILCLYGFNNKKPLFFLGEVQGQIACKIQGNGGFAYDPIFIPDDYQLSFAQLGPAIKNKISHRAKAWRKLVSYLEKN